jgi:DNA-binding CsgD family transcriptional regulator
MEPAMLARALTEVSVALEAAAVATAVAAARVRSVAEALSSPSVAGERVMPQPARGFPTENAPLSPREREVLALVAEGRSNKAIATALSVSPSTVKTHVASLLHKLRADTRVQLATIATRQGLHTLGESGVPVTLVADTPGLTPTRETRELAALAESCERRKALPARSGRAEISTR